MSDQKQRTIEKMPHFGGGFERTWIVNALATMTPRMAAEHFLKTFPAYDDRRYGNRQQRINIIRKRFYSYNKDKRLSCHAEIKQKKASSKDDAHDVPMMLEKTNIILYLEKMLFYRSNLTVTQERRILSDIIKVSEKLEKNGDTSLKDDKVYLFNPPRP